MNEELDEVAAEVDEQELPPIPTEIKQDLIDLYLPKFQEDLNQLEAVKKTLLLLRSKQIDELSSPTCRLDKVQEFQATINATQSEYDRIMKRWERLSGIEQILAALEGQSG